MRKVYVAGPYSADNVISVLDNMRRGMRVGVRVLLKGYAPFVPWLDYHFSLMLQRNEKLNVGNYYDYSMAWLEVSDYMLVHEIGVSKGVMKEIVVANRLNIPIFYSLGDLINYDQEYNGASDGEMRGMCYFDKIQEERFEYVENTIWSCKVHKTTFDVEHSCCPECWSEYEGWVTV